MVPPMADEFYEKYKHLSHQELYRMLHSGSVRQSDSVGDTWGSIASTLSGLAGSLRQDMDQLLAAMAGNASQDVLEGISALAKRAKLLSEEATSMRTGVSAMAQALAAAQRQAEAPQEIPAATAAVGSVLGAEVGHVPTPEELARARERMVWLVARLAAQYGIAEHAHWPTLMALPVAIAGGAQLIHHGHGHGDGHHRRLGTRLQGIGDLVRQRIQQPSFLSPYPGHGGGASSPLGLGYTSAEAAGALRSGAGVTRTPGVHIVGGGAPAVPLPSADGPAAAAAAPAAGAAPPPPVGLGGAGMAQSGPVLGGSPAAGVGAPGGLIGGHGLAGEVTWQSADNVEWMDPDDAAPPVIGA